MSDSKMRRWAPGGPGSASACTGRLGPQATDICGAASPGPKGHVGPLGVRGFKPYKPWQVMVGDQYSGINGHHVCYFASNKYAEVWPSGQWALWETSNCGALARGTAPSVALAKRRCEEVYLLFAGYLDEDAMGAT